MPSAGRPFTPELVTRLVAGEVRVVGDVLVTREHPLTVRAAVGLEALIHASVYACQRGGCRS